MVGCGGVEFIIEAAGVWQEVVIVGKEHYVVEREVENVGRSAGSAGGWGDKLIGEWAWRAGVNRIGEVIVVVGFIVVQPQIAEVGTICNSPDDAIIVEVAVPKAWVGGLLGYLDGDIVGGVWIAGQCCDVVKDGVDKCRCGADREWSRRAGGAVGAR